MPAPRSVSFAAFFLPSLLAELPPDILQRMPPPAPLRHARALFRTLPPSLTALGCFIQAFSPSTPGVVQDEYIIVSPGQRLGASPFEGIHPATSAGFVGMLQYVASPRADMGLDDSPLLQAQPSLHLHPSAGVDSHSLEAEQAAECFG